MIINDKTTIGILHFAIKLQEIFFKKYFVGI